MKLLGFDPSGAALPAKQLERHTVQRPPMAVGEARVPVDAATPATDVKGVPRPHRAAPSPRSGAGQRAAGSSAPPPTPTLRAKRTRVAPPPSAPPVRAEDRAGENDALLVAPVRRPPLPRPEPCPPTPTCAPQSESSAAMRAARACPRP
jgi:hypothetical protein